MTTVHLAETMTEAIDAIADLLPLSMYLRLRTLAESADAVAETLADIRCIVKDTDNEGLSDQEAIIEIDVCIDQLEGWIP